MPPLANDVLPEWNNEVDAGVEAEAELLTNDELALVSAGPLKAFSALSGSHCDVAPLAVASRIWSTYERMKDSSYSLTSSTGLSKLGHCS